MEDFKTITENNIHFDYDLSFSKTDSFEQKILHYLNTWLKEFHYDQNKGFDHLSFLQGRIRLAKETQNNFFKQD